MLDVTFPSVPAVRAVVVCFDNFAWSLESKVITRVWIGLLLRVKQHTGFQTHSRSYYCGDSDVCIFVELCESFKKDRSSISPYHAWLSCYKGIMLNMSNHIRAEGIPDSVVYSNRSSSHPVSSGSFMPLIRLSALTRSRSPSQRSR